MIRTKREHVFEPNDAESLVVGSLKRYPSAFDQACFTVTFQSVSLKTVLNCSDSIAKREHRLILCDRQPDVRCGAGSKVS
jgi:hypothetical protein